MTDYLNYLAMVTRDASSEADINIESDSEYISVIHYHEDDGQPWIKGIEAEYCAITMMFNTNDGSFSSIFTASQYIKSKTRARMMDIKQLNEEEV